MERVVFRGMGAKDSERVGCLHMSPKDPCIKDCVSGVVLLGGGGTTWREAW